MRGEPERVWTVVDVLRATSGFLERRGVENARGNAEQLLAHQLGCSRLDLYLEHDRPLNPEERDRYKALVKRRVDGEPLQYLVGHAEFLGLRVRVGPGVLIPRPETETLASEAASLLDPGGPTRVVDLGCGSGALALFFADRWPGARVLALDRSPQALRCTADNARALSLSKISCLAADLARLPIARASVDLLVSNPPYVTTAELASLAPEVRLHEPRVALDGGRDGFDALRALLPEAARALRPGAWLGLEVAAGQAPEVARLCAGGPFGELRVRPDLAGIERVVLARRAKG